MCERIHILHVIDSLGRGGAERQLVQLVANTSNSQYRHRDGPLASELRETARKLNISESVYFVGRRSDIGACLEMADIFVFPSLFEGLGIALLEAMSKALPCIASSDTAIAEHAIGYFPYHAIKFCLERAGISLDQVSAIGWSNNPYLANQRWIRASYTLPKQILFRLAKRLHNSGNGLDKALRAFDLSLKPWEEEENEKSGFRDKFRFDTEKTPFYCFDHHLSHAASAYYASGLDEATCITWDGSGDGLTCTIYHGKDGNLGVVDEFSEFSIGEFYYAIHRFLDLSDEGSLMGLAGYGKQQGYFKDLIDSQRLYMDLTQVSRPANGNLHLGHCLSLIERLGPPHLADEPLEERHKDIAADVQQLVEDFGFSILRRAVGKTGCRNVVLAGGVALNATMNGKIARSDLGQRNNFSVISGSVVGQDPPLLALGCRKQWPVSRSL